MKKLVSFILVAIMALGVAGCNQQPKMGSGTKVLATSGSEKLLLRDYLYGLGTFKAQTEYYYSQLAGFTQADFLEYWPSDNVEANGKTMFDELKTSVLEQMQDTMVFAKLAKDNGVAFDKAEMDEFKTTLDNVIISMASKEKTGERAFYEIYYVTKEEALESAKVMSAAQAYKDTLKTAIEVSDEEVQAYSDDELNKTTVENLEKVTVAHILLKVAEGATDAEKQAVKAETDAILARIQAGEDFGTLAAEFSEDDGSNTNNGEYTIGRNESFVPEFMDWTFQAEVGDLDIIETSYGYHIMKLVSGSNPDDVKVQIKDTMISEKHEALLTKTLEENPMEWVLDEAVYDAIVYVDTRPEQTEPGSGPSVEVESGLPFEAEIISGGSSEPPSESVSPEPSK